MKRGFITLAAAALIAVPAVQAQEPTIADLQKQLQELSEKIAKLEAQQTAQPVAAAPSGDLATRVEKLEEEKVNLPDWVATTQLKGDFRYRYENREDNGSNAKDRQRIRARIGVDGQVNETIDYGLRLATGGSATSSNQTLGDDNNAFDIFLDRVYVDIHPEQFGGAHAVFGKMPQPWLGRTGLVWDSDLNPEGVAVIYSKDLNDTLTLHANAGAFVVRDEEIDKTGSGSNARLQAAQVAFDAKVSDNTKVQVGASDYWFENMDLSGAYGAKNNNAADTYNIIEGFGSVSTKAVDLPVKFYGQIAQNTDAEDKDENTAYLLGVTLGKAKAVGSWEVGYNWRDIGKDSVVGAFNDSDFNDGNTDSRGHVFKAKYQIAKNWQAGAAYLMTEGSKKDVDTLQLDLMFKF
jgi:hypothetical protein